MAGQDRQERPREGLRALSVDHRVPRTEARAHRPDNRREAATALGEHHRSFSPHEMTDVLSLAPEFPAKLTPLMDFDSPRRRYYVSYGGRGSGKSWAFA